MGRVPPITFRGLTGTIIDYKCITGENPTGEQLIRNCNELYDTDYNAIVACIDNAKTQGIIELRENGKYYISLMKEKLK
jgi:hypothetical protein